MGGWVAGPAELIGHLRYAARPFLFSAALAPASAGAALEALRVLRAEPSASPGSRGTAPGSGSW